MQRPLRVEHNFIAVRELVLILCLAFGTWFLAELSNGILDFYAKASLIPALGLVACAIKLWRNLQQERDLRRQAEQLLRTAQPLAVGVVTRSPTTTPITATPQPLTALSERERQVLSLIASSCTNQRIAQALNISLNTVERHTANVYRKLGVRGRVEATHYAVRLGLVTEKLVERCREAGNGS
ncbi:MAG TPA: LuxR C-terminal-related transcriptional regulator [Dehalococcoidia bacterium]|nr:LuxR C-terminal-related transcriptional regulator [Dehalococcoidia bacterium]